jgi:cyclase
LLKKRLIPNIILNEGNVVQSVNFKHTNVIGNAITAVDFFNSWAIDEIIVLDVSRTRKEREKFHKIIRGLSKRCFVPLTVGGWISDIDEIKLFLKEGADKICINTEAVKNNLLIKESSEFFGSQCIVVSIDVKKNVNQEYEVFINRGKDETGLEPIEWAKKVEKLGAGEILLTSIDKEGTKQGYDLKLLKEITNNVGIPVISFGGVGKWEHFVDGINVGNADAVSAANIFHYTEHSTFNAKKFLFESKLNVRMQEFYKLPTPRKPKYDEIF